MDEVNLVGTPADCWSANKNGYLGMIVHWQVPNNRVQDEAVLACERIMGSHTHDALAQAMENIHSQFGIVVTLTI